MLLLCLHTGNSRGQRHYVFGVFITALSIPFFRTRYLRNTRMQILQILLATLTLNPTDWILVVRGQMKTPLSNNVDFGYVFTLRHAIKSNTVPYTRKKQNARDLSAMHIRKTTTDNLNFRPYSLFRINISVNPTPCQFFHFRVTDYL